MASLHSVSGMVQWSPAPTLRELILITGSLRNIISKSFGPSRQSTLLASADGRIIVSRDGQTLVNSLHLSHPIAKCVVDCVNSFYRAHGDGCKTVIIYLNELLKSVEKSPYFREKLSQGRTCYPNNCVASALQAYLSNDLEGVFSKGREIVSLQISQDNSGNVKNLLAKIVTDLLNGLGNGSDLSHLKNVLTSFLEVYIDVFHKFCLSEVDTFVLTANGVPFNASTLVDGFCFRGLLHSFGQSSMCILVDLEKCSLITSDSEKGIIQIDNDTVAREVIGHKFHNAKQFFLRLKRGDVTTVFVSGRVPSFLLQVCRGLGISLVALDEHDDFELLSSLTLCVPVMSVFEELLPSQIFTCDKVCNLNIGDLHVIELSIPNSPRCCVKTLILGAPFQSVSSQLKRLISKCCVSLQSCLGSDSDIPSASSQDCDVESNERSFSIGNKKSMERSDSFRNNCEIIARSVIPGGGYFEFLISKLIMDRKGDPNITASQSFCCKVVSEMLQSVPLLLHSNLSRNHVNGNRGEYLHLQQEAYSAVSRGLSRGFNSFGELYDEPMASDSLDVYPVKTAAVTSALSLAVQILRIDAVVGAARKS